MSNPNPMNSRCGLEDCDCEYTIGGLLRRLEVIAEQATSWTPSPVRRLDLIARQAKRTVEQTRNGHCDTSCLCYVAGYEAESRPLGA